jgi:hypothetical protein
MLDESLNARKSGPTTQTKAGTKPANEESKLLSSA